jgi:hypothetical protein
MKDLTHRLRDADPLRHEPGLPSDSRDAMRRAIVAAAEPDTPRHPHWRAPVALAAMAVIAVMGVAAAHRFADDRQRREAAGAQAEPAPTQVQFQTPGGTRIIWTIDPSFQLAGGRR